MPIDLYSPCPGGTGKKIKFCCPDFVNELNEIERLIEGEQFAACLQRVDHLLDRGPVRACLLASRSHLLTALQRFEESRANAEKFIQCFPDNPVALAESAIAAADDDRCREALEKLDRAMAASGDVILHRVYEAIGIVADALMDNNEFLAARWLLLMQCDLLEGDQEPHRRLLDLSRTAKIPLLLRVGRPLLPPPDAAPWADRLNQAVASLGHMGWSEAIEKLEKLSEEFPDAAAVWNNLAVVRSWATDRDGAIAALRKYAALDVPLDDAVEAEMLAMLLSGDPLGDLVEMVNLVWTVSDAERLGEALLSDPRAVQLPFNPAEVSDGQSPPPRMMFLFLDRAPPAAADLSLETMPNVVAQAMLFGRQTDREARLEASGVWADRIAPLESWLRQAAGDVLAGEALRESIVKLPASRRLLMRPWRPPADASPEQLDALDRERLRRALLEEWPAGPLGALGGKTPRQAAADPEMRVKLLAAIAMLAAWSEGPGTEFDFDELRRQLGLPTPPPIVGEGSALGTLPPTRLERVEVATLNDKDLEKGLHRAAIFAIRNALRRFAAEIVRRDSLAGQALQQEAYEWLARTEESLSAALAHVAQGRQVGAPSGTVCASWDLLELSLRIGLHDGEGVMRLIQHVDKQHKREPEALQACVHMLIEAGLLRPDGTPVQGPGDGSPPAAAESPAAEPSGLWTPDSAKPATAGKIWTPD